MQSTSTDRSITLDLVQRALSVRYESLPPDVRRVARDGLTDWLGCTIAASREAVCDIVTRCALEEGGEPQATLIARGVKASLPQATLVNGTASHALDYDDVNLALPGHVGVALLPGLVALAEHRGATTADFFAAFVAGYETACRIGVMLGPAHYANGFHATATIGSLGAAVACAHLLRLSVEATRHALGIAATQAAGLKAMFGSMAKPLHAGLAAQAGLRAALLAQRGFTSRTDALECSEGFAQVHGTDFNVASALAEPAGGYHLLSNLFKFHASCFSTHATIEAVASLRREHRIEADRVVQIHILAGECCRICNIQHPRDGLEAKFSLRAVAVFALLGMDTSRLETWERVTENEVASTLQRVRVELAPGMGLSESVVTLRLATGEPLQRALDCGSPMRDKAAQSARVAAKFLAITAPVVGAERSQRLLERLRTLTPQEDMRTLMNDCL